MNCNLCSRSLVRLAGLFLVAFFVLFASRSVRAEVIPVDTTIDFGVDDTDNNCTLREAILAANNNAPEDNCPAGDDSPMDIIVLEIGATYSLTDSVANSVGPTALPSITSAITISGNNAIIERTTTAPSFRLLLVEPSGNLTLQSVTLRNGKSEAFGFDFGSGGAIYNDGVLTITDSRIVSNRGRDGGGIYNVSSTTTLINTYIGANTALVGGGIYNTGSTTTLTGSRVESNTAEWLGGGVYGQAGSTITLNGTSILSNTAGTGAGITSNMGGAVILTDSHVAHNKATSYGGGIVNEMASNVTLIRTQIAFNSASNQGGGIYNASALAAIDSQVLSNTATTQGGGIYNNFAGTASLTNLDIVANEAFHGGGLYVGAGTVSLSQSRILDNNSLFAGGALQQEGGSSNIDQSCIMGNSATAVNYVAGTTIDATDNWWGVPSGPGGVGPGTGDSVSSNVNFAPILVSAPAGCPKFPLDFRKSVSPSGNLLPGQPLTYTLTITNIGETTVQNISIADDLPSAFILGETTTTPSTISFNGSSYVIDELLPSQVATIQFAGTVEAALTGDLLLSNTANATSAQLGTLTSAVHNNVIVPMLGWSQAEYTADEDSGAQMATVTLSLPNPYATVTVQALISDDTLPGVAAVVIQDVTFPPGSTSQQVVVPIADDQGVHSRNIVLGLQSPNGAKLGDITSANIAIVEDDHLGLGVEKSVNAAQAVAGDTLTYTYRITNTGNVTLTINATDNRLGAVAGLAGDLAPQATRSATLSYVVQTSDLPGPLVNTVTVTGTDSLATNIVTSDSASVTINPAPPIPAQPKSGLVVEASVNAAQAVAGDTLTYTYRITNTGNVTLTINTTDNRLGAVAGLAGELTPNATRSTTLTYVVQESDLPGPLTNTVTVTGTSASGAVVTASASTTITIISEEEPRAIYLPQIED